MEGEEASSYEEQMAQRKRAWKQQQQEGDDGAEEIIDGDDADAAGADASHDDEASGASVPAEVAALKERGNAAYKAREYEEAVKVRAAAAPPPSDPCRPPDAAGAVLHGGPAGGQRREGQGRAGGAQVAVAEPRGVPPAPGAVRAVRGRQHRCAPEL